MDINQNRTVRKWSRKELAGRVLWAAFGPLFRCSPRLCWEWRNFLLRLFGAKIGKNVQINPSAKVFIPWNLEIGDWSAIGFDVLIYNLGVLKIGEKVTLSHKSHICGGTHDYCEESLPLIKSDITIEGGAWVCAEAFVGPGVTVGEGSVLAARGVAVKDLESWSVYGGNPAKLIKERILKHQIQ